jgi:hypothetical protein
MDWHDNEFENFLKKFRLREPKELPMLENTNIIDTHRAKIAAAAALIVAIGASAVIVRQLAVRESPAPIAKLRVEAKAPSTPPAESPVPAPPAPELPEALAPSVKLDPKPKEPLKQLTVVVPPLPQAGEGAKSGREIADKACSTCHAAQFDNARYETPEEYKSLIDRMVGYGAAVTPAETTLLRDYLFRNFGKAKKDEGAIAAKFCESCHGLDALENLRGSGKDAFESVVMNMNDRGAGVPPDQIDPLVDYLFRTYGPRNNKN